MTLWQTKYNYGAILQNYALQKYLSKQGHNPFLIRYVEKIQGNVFFKIKVVISKMKKRIVVAKKSCSKDENRNFDDFIKKNMNVSPRIYIGYKELTNDPPEADAYIAGSDQVWNFYNTKLDICRDNIHAYFLDFGKENIRRMSYAASWDPKYVSDEQLLEIRPLINKLDYVSVREKKGLELCEKCGVKNPEWVVDPTLLLSAEEYRTLYKKDKYVRHIKKKYIFVYLVMTQTIKYNLDYVYNFAKKNDLEVIYVAEDKSIDNYTKYYPTIPEWLYLVDNADFVLTNSFHGTVFSLIFKKQFGTIPLKGYSSATNERIRSLFELFSISPRFVENEDISILKQEYNPIFKNLTSNFMQYLKD